MNADARLNRAHVDRRADGPNASAFQLLDPTQGQVPFKYDLVGNPTDDWINQIVFTPNGPDRLNATLHVRTDVNAAPGAPGQEFTCPPSGSGVPSRPVLTLRHTGGTQAFLTWNAAGFVVQQTTNVVNPNSWTDLPGGNLSPVPVTLGLGQKFFRLRKP